MTASNAFSASSFSMSNGGRIVKVTLWRVCFSNSVAMAFAAICVDPTLSTRTSAAEATVDETMSINVLTAIVRKDGRMMSSRNAAVVIARESTPEGGYPLFDHLVGAHEQRRRRGEAERALAVFIFTTRSNLVGGTPDRSGFSQRPLSQRGIEQLSQPYSGDGSPVLCDLLGRLFVSVGQHERSTAFSDWRRIHRLLGNREAFIDPSKNVCISAVVCGYLR